MRSLINDNLVDEYYIFANPVAIGNGLSIFQEKRCPRQCIYNCLIKFLSINSSRVLSPAFINLLGEKRISL
ncbi:hypothetical protein [Terrimonas ferruginea]|uniref:hypothetical protein n=1 Tax=Terrimonas ferruginea TaxID=249 RepID=UPI003CCC0F68